MVTAARVVQQTTQEFSPTRIFLPTPVIRVLTIVNKIHRLWSWYRRGTVYSNPSNFLKLAAGHGMNFAFGDSLLLRISATCVLIATRILECIEQQAKVLRSWRKLVDACKGHYCAPIKCTWKIKAKITLFSASTIHWFKHHGKSLLLRIQWVAICIFQLGKQVFLLSMRIMDAIDTFSLNASTANEGINEFFVNSTKWIGKLVENKELLIDGLISNKGLIKRILEGIGSPFTPEQLIDTATKALDKTAQFHETTEKVNKTAGVFITTCAMKWGHEFLYNLGLENLAPKTFIPSAIPPWEIPHHKKVTARFPPTDWITKPSMLRPPTEPKKVTLLIEPKKRKKKSPPPQQINIPSLVGENFPLPFDFRKHNPQFGNQFGNQSGQLRLC